MIKKLAGSTSVFRGDDVTFAHGAQGAKSDDLEITDGCSDQVQGRGCERWQSRFGSRHVGQFSTRAARRNEKEERQNMLGLFKKMLSKQETLPTAPSTMTAKPAATPSMARPAVPAKRPVTP